jgi:hypothetical protein
MIISSVAERIRIRSSEAAGGVLKTNKKKFLIEPKQTKTRSVLLVFRFVSQKNFSLFRFVSMFRTYIETTKTNRTVSKQNRSNPKFMKICYLLNCFGWSSVCFDSSKVAVLAQK